jgi:hypothetical protein
MNTINLIQSLLLVLSLILVGSLFFDGFLSILGGCFLFATSIFLLSLVKVFFKIDTDFCFYFFLLVSTVMILFQRTRRRIENSLSKRNLISTAPYLVIGGVLFGVSGLVVGPVIGWDARSIWLFHANWLIGNEAYTEYQRTPIFLFSHPDYPIAGSSSLAFFGRLTDSSFESMIRGFAFIQFCLAFYSGLMIAKMCSSSRLTRYVITFCVTSVLLVLGRDFGVTSGYMDLTNAIGVLAIFLTLTWLEKEPNSLRFKLLLLILVIYVSGLKQESAIYILIVAISWEVSRKLTGSSSFNTLYVYIGLFITYPTWQMYLVLAKVPKTSDANGVLTNLPINLSNIESFVKYSKSYFLLGGYKPIVVAIISGLFITFFHKKTSQFEMVQKRSLILILILLNAVLMATYTLGSSRASLEWWMANSFDRILLTSTAFSFMAILLSISPFDVPVRSGSSPLSRSLKGARIKKKDKSLTD